MRKSASLRLMGTNCRQQAPHSGPHETALPAGICRTAAATMPSPKPNNNGSISRTAHSPSGNAPETLKDSPPIWIVKENGVCGLDSMRGIALSLAILPRICQAIPAN